jgi:hypothetical protein
MADRQKGYGLTAELQDKIESKYDPQQEAEVRTWMIAVVKEPFPAGSFHEALNLVWTRLTFSKLRTFIKARTFLKLSKPYLP